jgi:hypothetical protein
VAELVVLDVDIFVVLFSGYAARNPGQTLTHAAEPCGTLQTTSGDASAEARRRRHAHASTPVPSHDWAAATASKVVAFAQEARKPAGSPRPAAHAQFAAPQAAP